MIPSPSPFPSPLAAWRFFVPFAILAMASHAGTDHDWKHRSSRRFVVTYDANTEHLVEPALSIAESTATTLGDLFGWKFKGQRIDIVLLDDDDEPNGASYGRTPLVQVRCRKAPMEWRDESRWLETVLSHELSHSYTLAQLQSPVASSFTLSTHSDEGLHEIQVAAILGTDLLPVWFVEGAAQLGSHEFHADRRDALREILLGQAWRTGRLLDLDEMSRFDGTSREYELAYNQGYDFLLYLRRRYPKVDWTTLCRNLGLEGFRSGMSSRFGKPLPELFEDWKVSLAERFANALPDTLGPTLSGVDAGVQRIESAMEGDWAVANWKHDMERLDLFQREVDGSWTRRARDVGPRIAVEPSTGAVWYAASFRNNDLGAEQYDIWRMTADGRRSRATEGARCRVFDVADGRLVYATYAAGATSIVERTLATGHDRTLHGFPYDTSVREISLRSKDSTLLVLGTGEATRAAVLLGDGSLHVLWPTRPPVWSLAAWRGDTSVFVGLDSGVSRLYWSAGEGPWIPVGSGGRDVRSVWVDRGTGGDRLRASVHEDGGRVVRAVDPAGIGKGFPVQTDSVAWSPFPARNWNPVQSAPVTAPVIRMPFQIDMGYEWSRYSDENGSRGGSAWSLLATEEFAHPSLDRGFGLSLGAKAPSDVDLPVLLPAASFWMWYGGGDRTLRLSYGYQTFANGSTENGLTEVDQVGDHLLQVALAFPVGREWSLDLAGGMEWAMLGIDLKQYGRTQSIDRGKVQENRFATMAAGWQRGDSRMDPAALGAPGYSAAFVGLTTDGSIKTQYGWLDGQVVSGRLDALARWWWGDRTSFGLGGGVFESVGGSNDYVLFPGTALPLGGKNSFSGYVDDNLDLRAWKKGSLELRTSPFARRSGKVRWMDRTRFGARLDVGEIQYRYKSWYYIGPGNQPSWYENAKAIAASVEVGWRQGLVLPGRNDPSWFEIAFASPLARLDHERREDPFRLYFSAVLR